MAYFEFRLFLIGTYYPHLMENVRQKVAPPNDQTHRAQITFRARGRFQANKTNPYVGTLSNVLIKIKARTRLILDSFSRNNLL